MSGSRSDRAVKLICAWARVGFVAEEVEWPPLPPQRRIFNGRFVERYEAAERSPRLPRSAR